MAGSNKREHGRGRSDKRLDEAGQTEELGALPWDKSPYYEVSFAISRCRRYHEKMQSFYERWHDRVAVSNAVLSGTAFVSLVGGKGTLIATILTALVATAAAFDAKLQPSKKAKKHSDLARRFTELASKLAMRDATNDNLRWASAERLNIEKDEPPVRRLVDLQAMNEEYRARGVPEASQIPLTRFQRRIGYYFPECGMARLERWKADREAGANRS